MEDDRTYQYIKLFLDYIPIWAVLAAGILIYLYRNPQIWSQIPKYVANAKFGDFQIELREVKEKLAETEAQVAELEAENAELRGLYNTFDPHAPVSELQAVRQNLKDVAGTIGDLSVVYPGLAEGAEADEVYAAAEILRERRDPAAFDALVEAVDRIASHEHLEGLRYHTVWTLASAVHKTVLSAVRNKQSPSLTVDQLHRARAAIVKLRDNPHVQDDMPNAPEAGIRGPCGYAITWIDRGLRKHDKSSTTR